MADNEITTGDIIDSMPRRMLERERRHLMHKLVAGVPLEDHEHHALWQSDRYKSEVGEPTARGAISEATGIPGVVRAGIEAYQDPSIATATNLGTRVAMTALKPIAAAKILAGGLSLGLAQDAGALPVSDANAGGLSPEQKARKTELEGQAKRGFTTGTQRRTVEQELMNLQTIERDAALADNASAAEIAKTTALNIERQRSENEAEKSRAMKEAEDLGRRARDFELSQDRKFAKTKTGQIWEATGGAAPILAGTLAGGLSRMATGGGSALNNYGIPAIVGGFAGGALSNLPLAYNAFSTEVANPERRAYEAQARELLDTNPEKANRLMTFAKEHLPELNPVRKNASEELYDLKKAAERIIFGTAEGVGGSLFGSDTVRAVGRGVTNALGSPGRVVESAASIRGQASTAYHRSMETAAGARGSRAIADGVAAEAERDALLSRQKLAESRTASAESRTASAESQAASEEAARRSNPQMADPASPPPTQPPRQQPQSGPSENQSGLPSPIPQSSGLNALSIHRSQPQINNALSPQLETVLINALTKYVENPAAAAATASTGRFVSGGAGSEWEKKFSEAARAIAIERAMAGKSFEGGKKGYTGQNFVDDIASRTGGMAPSVAQANMKRKALTDSVGTSPDEAKLMEWLKTIPRSTFALPFGLALSPQMSNNALTRGPSNDDR